MVAPYAFAASWMASRTCWKVPHRQILVMASSISASVGFGFSFRRGCHRHDHAALAIAALRNIIGDPGLLHLVQRAIGAEAFDGGDLFAGGFADRDAARAHRDPVDMDGAGAALCNAASVFGSGQSDVLSDRPKQRCIVFDIDVDRLAIDSEVCHRVSPD